MPVIESRGFPLHVEVDGPQNAPALGEEIARRIAGATLAAIDASRHSNVGQPKADADLVLSFPMRH